MLFNCLLEESATQFKEKTALIGPDYRLSYAELEREANRVARGLAAWGIRPGDRVAVWLPNSVELLVILRAVLKLGAVFTPVHPAAKFARLDHIVKDSGAAVLFLPGRAKEKAIYLLETYATLRRVVLCGRSASQADCTGHPMCIYEELGQTASPISILPGGRGMDPAVLVYTLNNVGELRGAVITQMGLDFSVNTLLGIQANGPDDVTGILFPLSDVEMLCQVLAAFRSGGTVALERCGAYPAVIMRWIERARVTILQAIPSIFDLLLQMDPRRFDCSALRCLVNSAVALPVSYEVRLSRGFPHAQLHGIYGLPECPLALHLSAGQLNGRPSAVGTPVPGIRAWLEDETGARVGPGRAGELCLQGPNVSPGYWGMSALSRGTELVFRTGDWFEQDASGVFYLRGRKDDLVLTRGERVAPQEVAQVLCQLPGVIDVDIVAVPDLLLGQTLKAVVFYREGQRLTEQTVLHHCGEHLEDFMVPQSIELQTVRGPLLGGP